MPRGVIIRYRDGQEYGIPDGAAVAKKSHPDAKIVRYDDGEPYREEKRDAAAKPEKPAKPAAEQAG